MYTKDKNHRITLRLNDEQFMFVAESAELLDVSPSDFLRMVINSSLVLAKSDVAKDALKKKLMVMTSGIQTQATTKTTTLKL